MRLIDADVLMPNAEYKGKYDTVNAYDIVNCPTVEAEPIRHGHWIGKPIAGYSTVRCSACRSVFSENNGKWNYCPNCGCQMDEVNND